MKTLTPSSLPPLKSAPFDRTAIAQDEAQLQAALVWMPGGDPVIPVVRGLPFLFKRAVDVVGASLGLFFLSPLLLLIAFWIRQDSPGPVLFRQVRRGHRGRPFQMLKFRTMTADAEQKLVALEDSNESAGGVLFKLSNDPRVTWLGSILRRSSLDELPQLYNVLRGQMSLVGPRPLQLRDSDRLQALDPEGYRRRLQVLPGVTGPWQVSGRKDVPYERMVELDVDYVERWSLARDLWIIGKTFLVVLCRTGAY